MVKQWKPVTEQLIKESKVSPGAHTLTKKPEDSGNEIVVTTEKADGEPAVFVAKERLLSIIACFLSDHVTS